MKGIQTSVLLVGLCILAGCSPKSDKPGSVAYLDFKNGIGGISFGSSVTKFTELGFAANSPDSDGHIYYTNEAFHITFGDFYLDNITLRFISDRLVYICGDVHCINQTDIGNNLLLKFLIVLFGERTSLEPTEKRNIAEDGSVYFTPGPYMFWWSGKNIQMNLYDGPHPFLALRDSRTIKAEEQEVQAKERKKESEEIERMRKQNF